MNVFLRTMFFLLISTWGMNAQSVWTGDVDSDWQNESNWVGGVPVPGSTATLPGTPQGGNFPMYAGGPIIDFTIQNAGILTFNSLVYNNGTIINFGGGTIDINSEFYNSGGGVIDNDGFFNVNASFINYGSYDHALSGETNIATGATFTHSGSFFKSAGPFINNGTVINNAIMRTTNLFENFGTLTNKNSFESPFGSTFNLHGTGTINNPAGTVFVINGDFIFDAGFTNMGDFSLQSAAVGSSAQPIMNNGNFAVSGNYTNNSTFTNNAQLEILDGGTMTNASALDNNGTITLAICGALVQNANNTIDAPVLNDGIIYLLNGNVEWTNVEFGNEFTDINQTKPPVAGCKSGFVYLDENGNGTLPVTEVDKGSYGSCGTTIANLSLSKTEFTTADLGANLVTLTVEDNLGVVSTCDAVVTVFAYVPPVVPVDDPDVDFECPDDVLVSTLPGAATAVATWDEPTVATTNCQGGSSTCAERSVSNTTQCNAGQVYGFYLKLAGTHFYYAVSNASFIESEDGTAQYTAHLTNNEDASLQFDLVANLSGRTFTTPAGGAKDHTCLTVNQSDWYFYETVVGTLNGTNALNGAVISITDFGSAFQIGTGANVTSSTNDFGASGWFDANIDAQPTNGPNLSIAYGNNPQAADINIMLSGNSTSCMPMQECGSQTNIPGFIYLGEFNNSKYYCSDNNQYTWFEARAAAEANGGQLAIVDDIQENNFIQGELIADYAWIGLSDHETEGTFKLVNGELPTFLNWNAGEPNNSGGNEDFVRLLKSNGKWTDRNESFVAEFVMEIACSNTPVNTCEDITVAITFDNYPEDISWEIRDADGNVIAAEGNYGNEPDQSTVTHTVCLTDGCYDFIISDSYGDGLCCQYGEGSYTVTGAQGVLASGAGFTTGETTNICISTGGTGPAGPPVITQISGPENGAAFFAGVTEVAYEVTDECGNSEICIFNVEVEQTPSEITFFDCPADLTINTAPGATSAVLEWTAPTASTTCFNDGLVLQQSQGPEIGDVLRVKDGPQLVAYTAVDSCGNFEACVFTVRVEATPSAIEMFNCQTDINIEPAAGETSATVTWDAPTATTTCFTGVINVQQVAGPASGSSFEQGTSTTIIYIVNDDCGNSEICIFNVTVDSCPAAGTACDDGDIQTINDQEDGNCNCIGEPVVLEIDCQESFIIQTAPGAPSAIASFNLPTVNSNCIGGFNIQQTEGAQSGSLYPIGINLVSFNVTDQCGNIETCSFEITVEEVEAIFSLDCIDNINVSAPFGSAGVMVNYDVGTPNGNCYAGFANSFNFDGPVSGSVFQIGITTVTYSTSDLCGNSASCSFTVTVTEEACPDADGDGVCAADDCDDNDAAVPAAPGTACDDGNADTENDMIGADGCSCSGTQIDPCDALGGDADGDGVCAADDCDDNDPNFPMAAGTACDDGNADTENDVIGADGCSCAGTQIDPCDALGGDADGDGVCAADDCDDNDPNFPMAAGTACDDGNADTENDVIGSDGCSCAGTQIDPCDALGGDADGDGVCAADDCDDNDPNFPMATGTACDDGNADTENDVIGADGCSCAGTQIDPCDALGGDADGDGVCAADDCDDNDPNFPMAAGTACDDGNADTENDVIGADGCSCAGTQIDPCDALGGDADGDGVCAADDCDDNDPNFPMAAGTACDDGNADTENDVIGADGCSCAGTPVSTDPDCADIVITPGNGTITISGLTAPITTIQVFNASWNEVFKCAGNCDPDIQVISGLDPETHFVKVAFYTASWNPICSVEDYYEVGAGDPCDGAGGDMDGDGVCAADDCDDNDASVPAAPGTACDDGDAMTIGDVIGADGCSCAGVPDTGDPCDAFGGDADGDGVCAVDDCDDNDPNFPMAAGTACDDSNAETENDVIGADGCSCAGTPIVTGPDCANISVTTGDGSIIVSGLDGAPISSLQIFDENWSEVFKCIADCNPTETIIGLTNEHTYFVKVAYYDASWSQICSVEGFYKVYANGGDPCETYGGDADGDGVCADFDCDDNDASLPAAEGTACDDGDAATENDVIQADGCSCAGTVPSTGSDCDNILITPGEGTITVSGLENAPVTSIQIFDNTWYQVFKCAGNCDPMEEIVSDLAEGTYFVKVAFYDASWNPVCAVENFYDVLNSTTPENGPNYSITNEFFVEKNERAVDIVWGTNRGPAIQSYEIERSVDGVDFEQLIEKENEYLDLATHFYKDQDEEPEEGWNFYRLKQTLIDGSVEYSEARKVHFLAEFEKILLFPNPAMDEAHLYLKSFVGMDVQIEIYDNLGQLVKRQSYDEAPATPIDLDIRNLQAGTYHVTVKTDSRKIVTSRLVVMRD